MADALTSREHGAILAHDAAVAFLRELRDKCQRDFDDADRAREFGEVLAASVEVCANG